jgi:hypothetical protein
LPTNQRAQFMVVVLLVFAATFPLLVIAFIKSHVLVRL